MKTTIKFSYTVHVVPPRCRKSRPELMHDGVLTIKIPELTASQAPIAILSKPAAGEHGFEFGYRWYAGKLWTSINVDSGKPRGMTANRDDWDYECIPAELDLTAREAFTVSLHSLAIRYDPRDSRDEVVAVIRNQLKGHVLIDGIPHRPAREPRYVAMTFGLGRNHGGTAVMVSDFFNDNIRRDAYYSLLEKEQALDRGTRIATEREDTKSLPMTVNGREYDVLLVDAIKVNANRKVARAAAA